MPRDPRARRCLCAAGGALLLLAAACAPPTQDPETSSLGEDVEDPAPAWGTRVDLSWLPGCGTGEDLWKVRDSTTIFCEDDGVPLGSPTGSFEWPVFFTGDDVDTIVVTGESLAETEISLAWATLDSGFVEGHAARGTSPSSATADRSSRIHLAGLPSWSGPVRRLRLSWSGASPETSRLLEIRAEKRSATHRQLAELIAEPRRVRIEERTLDAWAVLPGAGLEIAVDETPARRLRASYAVDGATPVPVSFRVDDLETGATLFEDTVPAWSASAWREVDLELTAPGAEETRLALLVATPSPLDPTRALAYWSLATGPVSDSSRSVSSAQVRVIPVDWEERARRGLASRAEAPARSHDAVR